MRLSLVTLCAALGTATATEKNPFGKLEQEESKSTMHSLLSAFDALKADNAIMKAKITELEGHKVNAASIRKLIKANNAPSSNHVRRRAEEHDMSMSMPTNIASGGDEDVDFIFFGGDEDPQENFYLPTYSLVDLYTKAEIDAMLANTYTKAEVDAELNEIRKDVAANKDCCDANKNSITSNDDDITDLQERVTATEGAIVDNKNSITSNDDDITDLQEKVTATEGAIVDNKNSITSNDDDITDLQERVTATEGAIVDNKDCCDANTDSINNLSTTVTTIQGDITNLEKCVAYDAGSDTCTVEDSEEQPSDEVCYGGYGTPLSVSAVLETPFDSETLPVTDELTASLDFGVFEVDDEENLLVNVMVQSMIVYGYDDDVDDDFYSGTLGDVAANVALYTIYDTPVSKIESEFPGGLTMSHVGIAGYQTADDDGNSGGHKFESVNNGKFFFPGLASGTYLLRVEFDLEATQIPLEDDADDGTAFQNVTIGEHLISVTRSVNKGQCNLQVELE